MNIHSQTGSERKQTAYLAPLLSDLPQGPTISVVRASVSGVIGHGLFRAVPKLVPVVPCLDCCFVV